MTRIKKTSRSLTKYKHRLHSEDDNLESLDSLNINRIKNPDLNDKRDNKALGEIYKSKAPEIKGNQLKPLWEPILSNKKFESPREQNTELVEKLRPEHRSSEESKFKLEQLKYEPIVEEAKSSRLVEELRPEHRYKFNELDNLRTQETNEIKILNSVQQNSGIFKLSKENEMMEYIDLFNKLEKAIENGFDENWFLHSLSDKSKLFGKADLLLSNNKTQESISIQLKLKESIISEANLQKLVDKYKETDIIIVGFKDKNILENQIKIVENMKPRVQPPLEQQPLDKLNKIHFVDLSPYYSNEDYYYDDSQILNIIKQSKLNKDKALFFEEKYNNEFESKEPMTKEQRRSIDKEAIVKNENTDNIAPNVVVPTVKKDKFICGEFNIKNDDINFKSDLNNHVNNDYYINNNEKSNQD